MFGFVVIKNDFVLIELILTKSELKVKLFVFGWTHCNNELNYLYIFFKKNQF